jgi:hypothetical protein
MGIISTAGQLASSAVKLLTSSIDRQAIDDGGQQAQRPTHTRRPAAPAPNRPGDWSEANQQAAAAISALDHRRLGQLASNPEVDLRQPDPTTGKTPLHALLAGFNQDPSSQRLACIRVVAQATEGGNGQFDERGLPPIQVAILTQNPLVVSHLIGAGAMVSPTIWRSAIGMAGISQQLEPGVHRYSLAATAKTLGPWPVPVPTSELRADLGPPSA